MNLFKRIFAYPEKQPSALPVDDFCGPDDFTWEQHHAIMKKKYPIRFFFNEDFRHWFSVNVTMNLDHFRYWFRSNFVPSRRYHILSLKQKYSLNKKTNYHYDPYRWGWIDSNHQIEYALGNILINYVEKERKDFPAYLKWLNKEWLNADEWSRPPARQIEDAEKVWALYVWYTKTRLEDHKEHARLLHVWHEKHSQFKRNNEEGRKQCEAEWQALHDFEDKMKAEHTEKFCEIVRAREGMWT